MPEKIRGPVGGTIARFGARSKKLTEINHRGHRGTQRWGLRDGSYQGIASAMPYET
jgi:hypothetical protein